MLRDSVFGDLGFMVQGLGPQEGWTHPTSENQRGPAGNLQIARAILIFVLLADS